MTTFSMAEIRERLNNATPGPWDKDKPSSGRPFEKIIVRNLGGGSQRSYVAQVSSPEDWEFIAAAPTDIAALLNAVEAARTLVAPILERTAHQIGTHYPGCWEHHIGCLAYQINQTLGGEA